MVMGVVWKFMGIKIHLSIWHPLIYFWYGYLTLGPTLLSNANSFI